MNYRKDGLILFEKLSKRLGIDVDKIVMKRDTEEKEKLRRILLKETIKERTRLMKEDNNTKL
jgi:hypothetical protein